MTLIRQSEFATGSRFIWQRAIKMLKINENPLEAAAATVYDFERENKANKISREKKTLNYEFINISTQLPSAVDNSVCFYVCTFRSFIHS
jgi:hypothetical protein